MRRFILPVFVSLALSGAAFGQDDALRAASERYVKNPVQQKLLDEMLSADAIVVQIRAMLPQLSEQQIQMVGQIASEEISTVRPALEGAMIDAAAQTFTLQEIVALEEFYSTPEGASVMRKMQPYMAEAMGMVAEPLQQAQVRIAQRIQKEIK